MYSAAVLCGYLNAVLLCRPPVSQFSVPRFWKAKLVTTTKNNTKIAWWTQNQRIMMPKGLFLAIIRLPNPPPLFNRVLITRTLIYFNRFCLCSWSALNWLFFFPVFLTIFSSASALMLNLLFTFSFEMLLCTDFAPDHLSVCVGVRFTLVAFWEPLMKQT